MFGVEKSFADEVMRNALLSQMGIMMIMLTLTMADKIQTRWLCQFKGEDERDKNWYPRKDITNGLETEEFKEQ